MDLLEAMAEARQSQSKQLAAIYPPEHYGYTAGSYIPWDAVVMTTVLPTPRHHTLTQPQPHRQVLVPSSAKGWRVQLMRDLDFQPRAADTGESAAPEGGEVYFQVSVPDQIDSKVVHGLIERTVCLHPWRRRPRVDAAEPALVAWWNVLLHLAYRQERALLVFGVRPWVGGSILALAVVAATSAVGMLAGRCFQPG